MKVIPTTVHWFEGGWHLSVNQLGEYSEYVWDAPTHWMPLEPSATHSVRRDGDPA